MAEYIAKKVIFKNRDNEYLIPYINEDENYELPIASTDTLGGIKVDGETIAIDENGVISLNNLSAVSVCIEEYVNGTSGYRVYSDVGNGRYCEQWGYVPNKPTGAVSVAFLKRFRDKNYNLVGGIISTSSQSGTASFRSSGVGYDLTEDGFTAYIGTEYPKYWRAYGYLA